MGIEEKKDKRRNKWDVGVALTKLLGRLREDWTLLLGIGLVGCFGVWIAMIVWSPGTVIHLYPFTVTLIILGLMLFDRFCSRFLGFRVDLPKEKINELTDFFYKVKEMEAVTDQTTCSLTRKEMLPILAGIFHLADKTTKGGVIARYSQTEPDRSHSYLRTNYDIYSRNR